jgi:hypothetical protein
METNEKKFFKKSEISQALSQAESAMANSEYSDYVDKSMYFSALNAMALVHIERGDKKRAKAVFNEILIHFDPHPWKYRHSDPKEIFMQYAMKFA